MSFFKTWQQHLKCSAAQNTIWRISEFRKTEHDFLFALIQHNPDSDFCFEMGQGLLSRHGAGQIAGQIRNNFQQIMLKSSIIDWLNCLFIGPVDLTRPNFTPNLE